MNTLSITVYGTPAPQGSKRHVGRGVMVESSKKVKPWREDVRQAALVALAESPEWDPGAAQLVAHMTFTLPRPRSHFRTGKNAHLLRDGAPRLLHSTKPDLDKLLRSTFDALGSAGVYVDDSRLAQVFAVKVYASADPTARVAGGLSAPGVTIILTKADS